MNRTGQQFASDNYAGITPEAWRAMEQANAGHCSAYGEDPWTQRACDAFRELLGTDCAVYFVFNGTAANSLALSTTCRSYHSILCHEIAHIETDECGAPEFFSHGSKILLLRGANGKVDPEAITKAATGRSDLHFPKPRAVSVTQATELGTVYRLNELHAISATVRHHGLHLHMDGARFANAVASLDVPPEQVTWNAGVDLLTFGGVKNGLMAGEAVIFFNKALADEFEWRCKQAGQLSSKMRFTSAAWCGLLESGVWLRNARHANDQAARLAQELETRLGLKPLFPREANAVFIEQSPETHQAMQERGWIYYDFIGSGGVRLMCTWDTSDETIANFLEDLEECSNG